MKKPIIGISSNIGTIDRGPFQGLERLFINKAYVDWVAKAGGIPLMLPILSAASDIRAQLELVDGLLLSGGQDVDPSYYNEPNHPLLGTVARSRDDYEMLLLKIAEEQKKPILGICRGLQLINVAFGGTLYQDLTEQSESHKNNHLEGSHLVIFEEASPFASLFSREVVTTNSFHHQAIKKLASGFEVVARSEDGVIEAIGRSGGNWIFALQWHPEVDNNPLAAEAIFRAFIERAQVKPARFSHKKQNPFLKLKRS